MWLSINDHRIQMYMIETACSNCDVNTQNQWNYAMDKVGEGIQYDGTD